MFCLALLGAFQGCILLDPGPILAVTPLAGRLAFAAVFLLLMAWLFWIPESMLQGEDSDHAAPSATLVRFTAMAIALFQALLYLLWA